MAEIFDTHIIWSGRGDDIYDNPVRLLATGEEDAVELFDQIVSDGLAIKNDGFHLAPVSPAMTEDEINEYDENKEALCAIIKGEDERFSIGDLIREYSSSNEDWLEEARTIVYDNDETDFDVTMADRG